MGRGGVGEGGGEVKGLMEAMKSLRTWNWWTLAELPLGHWQPPVPLRPPPRDVRVHAVSISCELSLG